MHEQTDMQLGQIYEQVELLKKQADLIKERVLVSQRIYLAQMSFEPLIGHHYFLYVRESGEDVLSMVHPNSWGKSCPFNSFIAEVKLLADHTWEIVQD